MSMSSSSGKPSSEWLRATLLSALGVVPLGACTKSASNSSATAPPSDLTLTVPDEFTPEPIDEPEEGTTTLRGYRFCKSHTPLPTPRGWYECDTGMKHRAKAKECPSELPRKEAPSTDDADSTCHTDSDCTDSPNGYCAPSYPYSTNFECQYGCITDNDCSADELCFCDSPVGRCIPTECHIDAECGERALCAIYELKTGESVNTFEISCQVPTHDQCGGDKDCASGEICVNTANPGPYGGGFDQSLVEVGAHVCTSAELPEGRPFLIDGHARTADAQRRCDWRAVSTSSATPNDAELGPEQRRTLHATWLRRALLEHASIAAFSRFSLQLLQLGAPAELLAETQRATLDEIEHARGCFELASRFGESPWGPSALDIGGAALETSLDAIVSGTILEGCIGETLAALEAAESAHCARDAQVKATLEQIARDEARHAALAWRFVAWALQAGDEQTRSRVAALFAAEAPHDVACSTSSQVEASVFTAHGVLPDYYRQSLRAQGLRDVIVPCAKALLGLGITQSPSSVSASRGPVAIVAAPPAA
jgi:hypothetical protein